MSKPLRVPLDHLAAGIHALPEAAARYVTRVHRRKLGDRLCLFEPGAALEADAELVGGPAPAVWCRVDEPRPSGYRPLPIHLIQGLGKGDKPDEVIRAATALGAARVGVAQTERSVARLADDRGVARVERWTRIAVEAARQSGRGDIPQLSGPEPLADALARVTAPLRITLAPGAEPLLARLRAWRADQDVALLVGPEGGLDERELELAGRAGFVPASLGTTVLRTELAGVAALGALVAFGALIRQDQTA